MMTSKQLIAFVVLVLCAACEPENLSIQQAKIALTPRPTATQTAMNDPAGIDCGQVTVHGLDIATFRIDNLGSATLEIESTRIASQSGGTFRVQSVSDRVTAYHTDDEAGELVISLTPNADQEPAEATIELLTNSGENGDETAHVIVRAVGLYIGDPNIEVCYDGTCYPGAEDCSDRGDGKNICQLPTLDWGNVSLGKTSTREIRLRNVPRAGTCLPPPGAAECTRVCRLTFDRDPSHQNLGFGFVPDNTGFEFRGNIELPHALDVANPQCGLVNEEPLLIRFNSGNEEGIATSTLVIENNDPDAPLIEIPLSAHARQAPVAVAQIRACSGETVPNCTPDVTDIRPLDRVYLTSVASFDTSTPPRDLIAWEWTVEESPQGANPDDFALQGTDTEVMSMWLPLAGRYVAKLRVTNDLGIKSGITPTALVEFYAIPNSRVHIQLVWDHPTNDLDLHVTSTAMGDLVCEAPNDCFWGNCKRQCLEPDSECREPPVWFASANALEGPNPRLDIDDTNGLGPENTNIDEPSPGKFRIYVHYYTLIDRSTDPTQAIIRIYIDGQAAAEYRRVLRPDDLWRVAEVEWTMDIDGSEQAHINMATSDGLGQGALKKMYNCSHPFDFGEVF